MLRQSIIKHVPLVILKQLPKFDVFRGFWALLISESFPTLSFLTNFDRFPTHPVHSTNTLSRDSIATDRILLMARKDDSPNRLRKRILIPFWVLQITFSTVIIVPVIVTWSTTSNTDPDYQK